MMCRDVVDATTDASEGALSGWRRISYRFHVMICPACRAHLTQVETAVAAVRAMPRPDPSEEARARALHAFKKKTDAGP
jgi:NMD protein affecting ribosome stability and mRNA decay